MGTAVGRKKAEGRRLKVETTKTIQPYILPPTASSLLLPNRSNA
jgi:hypothetical protein